MTLTHDEPVAEALVMVRRMLGAFARRAPTNSLLRVLEVATGSQSLGDALAAELPQGRMRYSVFSQDTAPVSIMAFKTMVVSEVKGVFDLVLLGPKVGAALPAATETLAASLAGGGLLIVVAPSERVSEWRARLNELAFERIMVAPKEPTLAHPFQAIAAQKAQQPGLVSVFSERMGSVAPSVSVPLDLSPAELEAAVSKKLIETLRDLVPRSQDLVFNDATSLVELGLDSQRVMQLVASVSERFGVTIPLSLVVEAPQLGALSHAICSLIRNRA